MSVAGPPPGTHAFPVPGYSVPGMCDWLNTHHDRLPGSLGTSQGIERMWKFLAKKVDGKKNPWDPNPDLTSRKGDKLTVTDNAVDPVDLDSDPTN